MFTVSSTDISYMSSETKSKISERGTAPERRGLGETAKNTFLKDVEVILDIARGDYVFTTQPGALRRIIMNLFGNSLKYTDKGLIVVSLALRELKDEDGASSDDTLLEITIKDTGKGISSTYLKSNLFTPFSQEDTLATGVGLGLSIVKSIVNTMNGSIEFQSQLGEGTEVCVKIPLMRVPGSATTESTPSTVSSSGGMSTCMQGLQSSYCERFAVLYRGNDGLHSNPYDEERARVLRTYITQWFGLKAASQTDPVDIVIVDEKDFSKLQSTPLRSCPTVVLCGASRPRMGNRSHRPSAMEYVSKPFGPYKLAKAIYTCLEKAKGNIDSEVDPTMTFPDQSPIESETGTIVPELGSLNISGQASSRSPLTEHQSKSDREDFPFPPTEDKAPQDEQSGDPELLIYPNSHAAGISKALGYAAQTPEALDSKNDVLSPPDLIRLLSRRPNLTQRATAPMIRLNSIIPTSIPISSAVTKPGEADTSISAEESVTKAVVPTSAPQSDVKSESADARKPLPTSSEDSNRPPRLLLVEDNSINLQLLKTYMKKRKYKLVDSAENGQLAVDAVETHEEGYDVIFMGEFPYIRLSPPPPPPRRPHSTLHPF